MGESEVLILGIVDFRICLFSSYEDRLFQFDFQILLSD